VCVCVRERARERERESESESESERERDKENERHRLIHTHIWYHTNAYKYTFTRVDSSIENLDPPCNLCINQILQHQTIFSRMCCWNSSDSSKCALVEQKGDTSSYNN